MIPKVIHYCWFGGKPLPELTVKCMESWRKFCPDFEIVRWDESNIDINACDYAREAYEAGKFAFVSDYARLKVLVENGGVYLDTDMEVLRPIDEFLDDEAFTGFERLTTIPTGIMASVKGFVPFAELLADYDLRHFAYQGRGADLTTNVTTITNYFLKRGLIPNNTKQTINGFTVYPKEYFCPINSLTLKVEMTQNTHTIHHFASSWKTPFYRFRKKVKAVIGPYMTEKILNLRDFIVGRKGK